MSHPRLFDFRTIATEALKAHDALMRIWRELPPAMFAESSHDDVKLLKELIHRRIYPCNAFEILAHLDQDAAIEMLLRCYFGNHVNPDTKFGGFEFEIGLMLDDLRSICGIEQVVRLVNEPDFALALLDDPRVRRVFSEVLAISENEVSSWVQSQRHGR